MRAAPCTTALILSICLLSASALAAQTPQKASGAALKISTTSAEARAAFESGVDAAENVLFTHAARHLQHALELDPKLGVARAYYGTYAPGLTAEQRSQELQRAATDAMNASLGELLLVLALRAPAGPERVSLLKAAVDAVPDDPHVLYLHAANQPEVQDRVRGLESLNRRFPNFAPAYNLLAYARARDLADVNGGLTAVQRYLELDTKNPNAHDSYAELLQWAGRYAEATQHYQHALDLDATYSAGYTGLAEVALLQGNGTLARTHLLKAVPYAATPQARLNLRQSIATTFVADGNVKTALSDLEAIAREAESGGYRAVAAQAYRNLALIEATLGNKTNVDAHLRKAQELSSADNNTQRAYTAAAYAAAGDVTGARPAAIALNDAASAGTSLILKRQAHGITAIVEAADGKLETATLAAANAGNFGALGKALIAEALKKQGKKAEARALADEVRATTEVDLATVIAKRRAKSI